MNQTVLSRRENPSFRMAWLITESVCACIRKSRHDGSEDFRDD